MNNYTASQASSINHHFDINVNSVKHYFPSPALSCVEAPPITGRVSQITFPEPNKLDVKSYEESSSSKAIKGLHISAGLMEEFMELAKNSTVKDMETCGILGASLKNDTYYVTALVMPKQESTANSCQALNEEEIHAILDGESLYPVGWIHVMLPEAVAIVMAPTDSESLLLNKSWKLDVSTWTNRGKIFSSLSLTEELFRLLILSAVKLLVLKIPV